MLFLVRLMCVLTVALLLVSPVAAAPSGPEAEAAPLVLGGGDELRVYVPGVALEGSELRTVDAEGRLDLGQLGAIKVGGLSLIEAERALRRHLEGTLRDATAATLTLHAHGVIVEVRGLVARPGPQVLRGVVDPWSALTAAGGALETADLERVSLRRGERDIPVDVRRWLVGGGGDTRSLPALQSGDSLFVPARPGFGGVRQDSDADILVVGAVVRPGFVAHTLPLDLWQLIGQAGGPGREADLTAVRVIVDGSSTVVDVAGALASGAPLTLARGVGAMSVFVPGRDAVESRLSSGVSVVGGVQRPGRHPLGAPTPLLEVLALAGGPTADGDLHRVTVVRHTPGMVASSVIDVSAHLGRGAVDIMVLPGDSVMVAFTGDDPVRTAIKVLSDVALVAGVVAVIVGLVGGAQ